MVLKYDFIQIFFCILTSPEQKQELGPLTQLEQGIEELVEGKVSQKLARGEALAL